MKTQNIQELWSAMELYHSQGLSMIWTRMETEVVNGDERPPKTPIGRWKQGQSQRFSLEYLAKIMASTNVAIAPAVLCGAISGNLEVIDIDVKHWPGIDTMYLVALKDLYPDLFARLRIHKTQSGGFHLLYRCSEPIHQGSKKLAVSLDEKGKPKEAGIETRGQGGYIVCPPGPGYSVHQEVPIPVIALEERNALITLARLFDQRIKITQVPHTKSHESVYDENPFDHFNRSPDAETVLLDHGWTVIKQNAQFIQFNRPGKEHGGGSASFIKEYRLYHIFTTSTEFEGDKNYKPAAVVAILKFNGNWKETYRYLVNKGFGKVKPEYEQHRVKKYASMKTPLPPNFSQEAKEVYERELNENAKKYPHGIFWEPAKDFEGYAISRLALTEVTTKLGFRLFKKDIVRIEKPYFARINDERVVYDILKQYIQEEDPKIIEDVINTFDAFWQYHGNYVLSRLPIIDESALLRSTRSACYSVFQNTILKITDTEITEVDPSTMDKLVDRATVVPRMWKGLVDWKGCKFVDFLQKAINMDILELQKVIGYLCWEYNDETQVWIIFLIEEMTTANGGGSGKGVFCQLFRPWTNVHTIDLDKHFKNSEILQSWQGESLVHINDLYSGFDLRRLKAFSSEGTIVKYLFKNLTNIAAANMPKIIISSQAGFDVFSDGGVKRRIFLIPFTGYFNPGWTPEDEYHGMIPDVWTPEDWHGYDSFVVLGIQEFMKTRRLNTMHSWNEFIWKKNFDHTYGSGDPDLREWVGCKIEYWACQKFHRRGMMNSELSEQYNEYCEGSKTHSQLSIIQLRKAIKEYCDHYQIPVEMDREVRENQYNRGRGIFFECLSGDRSEAA